MIDLALYQPEIPPNCGNVIRLCVNIGARLHLIHPLGFDISDRRLRRAGLDYRERACVHEHEDWPGFMQAIGGRRVLAFSTRGQRRFDAPTYRADDVLLFGPETRGLPEELLEALGESAVLKLPMVAGNRSLNLSNAAAVAAFEAWRQLDYMGT